MNNRNDIIRIGSKIRVQVDGTIRIKRGSKYIVCHNWEEVYKELNR